MISGVVFDFDDTLADSTGVHERVWPSVVEAIARHVPHLDAAAFLERYDGLMESHYERLLTGELDFVGFRRTRLQAALEPWSEVDDEVFAAYLEVKVRVVDDLRVHRDAVATIRRLRRAGVRVGVLTNGPSELQRRKLAVTGIAAEVDVVGISGEIGAHKPAGAAFAAVLDLLGCRPAEAAMVGDSLANDVRGAVAHGFARVVWVARGQAGSATTTGLAGLPEGVHRVRRLAEVPRLLGFGPARAGRPWRAAAHP